MNSSKRVHLFFIVSFTVIIFFSCGVADSNFQQVGYNKVELRNGSYKRVFSIYVKQFKNDPLMWDEMEKFARSKMYTANGFTMVFFFNDRNYTPDVTFIGEEFDQRYEKFCVGAYWKYPNGSSKFSKYPFENK